MKTIGTRREEDDSYMTIITLMVTWTVGVVLCSVLEMVFYFLYTMKVDITPYFQSIELLSSSIPQN